jgi:hypothetical protein
MGRLCKLHEQLGATVRHWQDQIGYVLLDGPLETWGSPAFCYESRFAGDADLCGSKVVLAACSAFFSDEIAVSHRNFCARNFG